ERKIRKARQRGPSLLIVINMWTHFILIAILLLQPSYADTNEPTVAQLNAWRDAIREYRHSHIRLEEKKIIHPLYYDLFRAQSLSDGTTRGMSNLESGNAAFIHAATDELDSLVVKDMVPEGAPLTLEDLKEPVDDLSRSFLEVYWECYETIQEIKKISENYPTLRDTWLKHNWHSDAQAKCEEKLRNNGLETVVGPSTLEVSDPAPWSRNLRMVTEREGIAERLSKLQTSDVSELAFSPFTQRHISSVNKITAWCEATSRIEFPEHENEEDIGAELEKLVYSINFNSLVSEKLDLIKFAVERFLDQETHNVPSASKKRYSKRGQTYISRLIVSQEKYRNMVENYKKELLGMLQQWLPDIESYLEEIDLELKKFSAHGVTGLSPELGIFLQLKLSDVPPEYLILAGGVQLVHSGHSLFVETLPDREGTGRRDSSRHDRVGARRSHGFSGCCGLLRRGR
ncbi:hypothetical protein SeMB42_g06539, partial [Synchytrium endobioticum]